jgi:hypothetical protein
MNTPAMTRNNCAGNDNRLNIIGPLIYDFFSDFNSLVLPWCQNDHHSNTHKILLITVARHVLLIKNSIGCLRVVNWINKRGKNEKICLSAYSARKTGLGCRKNSSDVFIF